MASCTSCGNSFKKNLLGLYKFANDIVKIPGFLSYAHLQPTATVLYSELIYVSTVELCILLIINMTLDVLH